MPSNNAITGARTACSSGVAACSEEIREPVAIAAARKKNQRSERKIFMASIVPEPFSQLEDCCVGGSKWTQWTLPLFSCGLLPVAYGLAPITWFFYSLIP